MEAFVSNMVSHCKDVGDIVHSAYRGSIVHLAEEGLPLTSLHDNGLYPSGGQLHASVEPNVPYRLSVLVVKSPSSRSKSQGWAIAIAYKCMTLEE